MVPQKANRAGSLLACGLYYWIWAIRIPKWRGYELRQELVDLGGGAQSHHLRKVPYDQVAEWDATHDASGREVSSPAGEVQIVEKGVRTSSEGSNSDAGKGAVQNSSRV